MSRKFSEKYFTSFILFSLSLTKCCILSCPQHLPRSHFGDDQTWKRCLTLLYDTKQIVATPLMGRLMSWRFLRVLYSRVCKSSNIVSMSALRGWYHCCRGGWWAEELRMVHQTNKTISLCQAGESTANGSPPGPGHWALATSITQWGLFEGLRRFHNHGEGS